MPARISFSDAEKVVSEKLPNLEIISHTEGPLTQIMVDVRCKVHDKVYTNRPLITLYGGSNCCKQCSHKAWDAKTYLAKVVEKFDNLDLSKIAFNGIANKVTVGCNIHKELGYKEVFAFSLLKHQPCMKCHIEKREKDCMERHGVKNTAMTKDVRRKMKESQSSSEVKKTRQETCMKVYGTTNVSKSDVIKQKISVKSAASKINGLSAFDRKSYTFADGRQVRCQGYEPRALKILEDSGYGYDDIQISPFSIKYEFNGMIRRYVPDIFIPKENRIIEVKSPYTYNFALDKNLAKQKACLEQGYKFEFMILGK